MKNDDLITKAEARKILDVSERTLYYYLNKGYIKKVNKGLKIFLSNSDVRAFKAGLLDPLIKADRLMLSKIYAQLREVQEDVDTIKRVLDMYYEPLELSDFSIHALYTAASGLEISSWEEGWEEEWGNILLRMREEDLFQLEKLTNEIHPWKPFYKLIMVIQDMLKKRKDTQPDLIDIFQAARQHFRKLIVIWSEIKNTPKEIDHLPKDEFGPWVISRVREKYLKKK